MAHPRTLAEARVLVVDPVGETLALVQALLPDGVLVDLVKTVQRALPRIDNEPIDLVVCDIEAPDMEQLLGGSARVAFLDGERVVAVNALPAPGSTVARTIEEQLRHVLACALARDDVTRAA